MKILQNQHIIALSQTCGSILHILRKDSPNEKKN